MAHIHNIKNHLSHWLQVHNKEPFEILKHKVKAGQNRAGSLARLHPNTCRLAFAHNLFEAEAKVFTPQIVNVPSEKWDCARGTQSAPASGARTMQQV